MPMRNLGNIEDLAAVSNKVVEVMKKYTDPAIAVADQQIAASETMLAAMRLEKGDIEDRLAVAEAIEQSRQGQNPTYWDNIINMKLKELGNPPREEFDGKVGEYRAALEEANSRILRETAYASEMQKRKSRAINDGIVSPLKARVAEAEVILGRINGRIQAQLPEDEGDTRALLHTIGEIASCTPDGLHSDFLQQLEINAKAALYDRETQSLRQQFRDKFAAQLSTPGAKDSVDLTATTAVKFGLVTAVADTSVNTTWETKMSYEVAVSDTGEITVKDAVAVSVDVGGGAKLASKIVSLEGKLKGTIEQAKENKYDSVDDFVNSEADRLARGFLDAGLKFTPLAAKNFLQMRKQENRTIELRETARSNKQSLEHTGILLGFLGEDETLAVPEIRDVDYTTKESTSAAVNLSGKFAAQDPRKIAKFEAGGSAEIKKVWERETHTVGYLDHLKARPALQEMVMMGRPHYFRFNSPAGELSGEKATRELGDLQGITKDLCAEKASAEEAVAAARAVLDDPAATQADRDKATVDMNAAKQRIRAVEPALLEIRRRVRTALEETAAEYSSLVQLENLAAIKGKTPKELSALRKSRGTESSVEHLKALTAQFVVLRRIYDEGFTSFAELEDGATSFAPVLDGVAHELSHPAIAMDVETYEKHFKAHEVKEGKKYKYKAVGTAEGGITKFGGAFLGGEVERSGNWNPKTGEVTDDTYTFRAKVKGTVNLASFVTDQVAWADGEAMEAVKQQLQDTLVLNPSLATSWPSIDAGFVGTIEWTVVKKHGQWRLKRVRASDEESVGIGGTVPIKAGIMGVDLGLKAARKQVRGRFDWMGTDNLDGWADAYEGLKLRRQDTDWAKFKADHQVHLNELMDNLKTVDSGVTKDMDKEVGDLKDDALKAEWDAVVSEFRAGTKERSDVLATFEKVMDKRVEKKRSERFKDFATRVRAQTVEEYALQATADAVLEQADELGLAPEQATGVEAIVAEAKRLYNADPSEASFKKLQKALALDHGVLSMEDMLASKNPKKVLAAQGGIVNGTYFADGYKKPKVYIDKGVYGELVRTERDGVTRLDMDIVAEKGTRGPDDVGALAAAKVADVGAQIQKIKRKARDGSEVGYFDKKYRPSMVRSLFSTTQKKRIREQLARVLEARRKRQRDLQRLRQEMQDKYKTAA